MLGSRQRENSDVRRVGQIFRPIDRQVAQGGDAAAIPVFGTRIHKENFRFEAGGDARAQAVAFSRGGIRRDFIANREDGLREGAEFVWQGESLIEAAKGRASVVNEE